MSKHTSGPWHLGGNGFIVYSRDGYAICDVKTFHGRNDADAGNARLIAAAPVLLEALAELEDAASVTSDSRVDAARRTARAAIDKATGAA